MTKLEELKAVLEASTPGEWEPLMTCGELHVCTPVNEGCDVGTVCVPYEDSDATFIALAHNNMAALLEVVGRLESMQRVIGELASTNPFLVGEFEKNKTVLEKLK